MTITANLINRASDMAITVLFFNGGPVYRVSLAVIYIATGRMGGGDFTGLKQTSNKA